MDVHEFLRSRRSIRRFTGEEIDAKIIERILETASFAPSSHNSQPWRFAVLKTELMKKSIADRMADLFKSDLSREGLSEVEINKRIARSKDRIMNSPVVIVLCMDKADLDNYPDSLRQNAESLMGIQSTSMAGLQLLLAAHAENLGAVWTCGPLFAPDAVCSTLALPESWQPLGMILIGHPAEKPSSKSIKNLAQLVKYVD